MLGSARRVTVTKDDTTIVDGAGKKEDVEARVGQIKAEIETTDSDWDREKLQERLAKLAGGLADHGDTGGQVVSPEVGLKLDQVGLDVLGQARRVVITKDDTTIVEGAGDADAVAGRVNQIKAEIESTDSDWDREKLQERLAKLAGGVCVVKVGAATEVELKEKKHRIEDAVSATRAAIEEGIIAGGGSALVHAVSVLGDSLGLTGDEAAGVRIVAKAADEPLRWIAENGGVNGYVVVAKVREGKAGEGYNAATEEYGDLVAQGVLDPVKVTRSALVNAASIAGMLLTTETLVVEKPEDDDESAAAGGHGHGHGHGH